MGNMQAAVKGCFEASDKPEDKQRGRKLSLSGLNYKRKVAHLHAKEGDGESHSPDRMVDTCDHSTKLNTCEKEKKGVGLDDFRIVKMIGEGSFGKVFQVQRKRDRKELALKVLRKKDLVKKNLLECILNEKNILKTVQNPFIVHLESAFQTETRVFLVTEYCSGGDLGFLRLRHGVLREEEVKFYVAEVVLALQYLHEKLNVIHRDVKPENILIADDGHIKITDFGIAKTAKKTKSFCGTCDFLAPEIIRGELYDNTVDWWSLGCLIYELLTGHTPFTNESTEKMIHGILTGKPALLSLFSEELRDLLRKLLIKDPKKRLGANGAEEIKQHAFFKGIDWGKLERKELMPPKLESWASDSSSMMSGIETARQGALIFESLIKEDERVFFSHFTYDREHCSGRSGRK